MAAAGPAVRGLCPAGHVVETRAPARRITWRGPCPHELDNGSKCGLHVVAQRVAEPPPNPSPLEPVPQADANAAPVRKVAAYRDHGLDTNRPDEPGFSEPSPPDPPSGLPGISDPDPEPADPGPAEPRHPHPPPRPERGRLARWGDRLRAPGLDVAGDESDWTIPGIYE